MEHRSMILPVLSRNSKVATLRIALAFAIAFLLPLLSHAGAGSQAASQDTKRHKLPVPKPQLYGPAEPQELDGAFWRTDAGFQATIRIANIVQTSAIRVTPVLFMADGTEYSLPPVDLQPAGVATVSINDALSSAPREIAAHVSAFGSAALRFQWPWSSAVSASIRSLDAQRSLTYSNSFQTSMVTGMNTRARRSRMSNRDHTAAPRNSMEISPQAVALEGLWWKRDPEDDGFIVLINRSEDQIPVTVKVLASGAKGEFHIQLLLLPHHTRNLDLKSSFDNLSGLATSGGIRIEYRGVKGSVLATGGMENVSAGYSARIPFSYASPNSQALSWTIASVGLMHGPSDTMMQFPADTRFISYAVLRNISSQPMQVTPIIYATPGRQAGTAQVNDQALSVPPLILKPGETKALDLEGKLENSGLKNVTAGLTLSLNVNGVPGSLLAVTGSVDQTGNYVFEVEPHTVSPSLSKTICFFDVGNGNDTMVSLWNHSDQPEDLLVTVFFKAGHYKLPLHLAPRQSAMFNLLEIIKARSPDIDGNTIPSATRHGIIVVSGPEHEAQTINATLNAATFNVKEATCDFLCQSCDGYDSMAIDPGSLSLAVGGSQPIQAIATYSNGMQFNVAVDWSSSNTAVATVSDTVHAVGSGTATISGSTFLETPVTVCETDLFIPKTLPLTCPILTDMSADEPVTVNEFTLTGPQTITDGDNGSLAITVTSGTPTSYQWSFSVPVQGAGNSPNVAFTAPTTAQTNTDGHWYAFPNANCPQADQPGAPARISPYTIKASVRFQGDNTPIEHTTTLSVNFIWFRLADTGQADITGNPAMAPDAQGVWHITGIGTMTRVVPTSNILVPPSNQFYNKTVQHEQVHVAQWSPGRLNGDLYIPSVLLNRVINFTGISQADLQSQFDKAKANYFTEEINLFVSRKPALEHEAYLVSDLIAPQYMVQGCEQ